ncbi:MAG: hypothetical protein ACXACY_29720 [Candidatus Hodarchaeales archaeon]|jgi:hypothetical protein
MTNKEESKIASVSVDIDGNRDNKNIVHVSTTNIEIIIKPKILRGEWKIEGNLSSCSSIVLLSAFNKIIVMIIKKIKTDAKDIKDDWNATLLSDLLSDVIS